MYPKSVLEQAQQGDRLFRWRGANVSRLEALFDVILAMALTLTMVSAEVPKSFADLVATLRQWPAFAICFAILVLCWFYHFRFHRRYGLEDLPVIVLSCALMFVVISYVYPLKFLYSFLLGPVGSQLPVDDVQWLMIFYSGGFAAIFLLFAGMYGYAWCRRRELELSHNEQVLTKMAISEQLWYVAVALISIACASWFAAPAWSGLVYAAIGPLQLGNGLFWSRYLRQE